MDVGRLCFLARIEALVEELEADDDLLAQAVEIFFVDIGQGLQVVFEGQGRIGGVGGDEGNPSEGV